MDTKSLEKLEYNKILNLLENFAITYKGKNLVTSLKPLSKKEDIEKALKQTTEASTLLYRKGNIPLQEIATLDETIKKLESGLFLNIIELLNLSKILKISNELKNYFFSTEIDMSEFIKLNDLFNNLYINPQVEKEISNAILDENTISNDASINLKQIRKSIISKEAEIKNKLNSLAHSKYVQENVITIRQGRYVIPVKVEYQSQVKGFIHDISQSGSTVFIEPVSIFELNNDLNNLKIEENIEIEKILQKLSSLFFPITDNIKNNMNLIGIIDFIFAKAKYSNSLNATEPTINDKKTIYLKNAWHPLLNKSKAIKNDIILGDTYNSLIITGPNTGGKTVTLKTTGLLLLMALSGMHIPASEGSSIFIVDNVFADIGDEQSIQDSLSTFSSHMTNIANILKEATSESFVLLDELGSGTDPEEGSSLAISILEEIHSRNILCLSTTHYPELKHFALITDGFENASVEFNLEKMSPTYKLLLGVPGTSNAFLISKKLGIPEDIIERAKKHTSQDKIKIEKLLNNIYEDKRLIEIEKEKTLINSNKIEKLKMDLEKDYSELTNKQKELIDNAKDKARTILLNAKDDANEIIKDLENSNNTKYSNKLRNKLNTKINDLSIVNSNDESKAETNINDLKINMNVFIKKLNQEGTILSISKDGKVQVQLSLGKMFFNANELTIMSSKSKSSNNKVLDRKDYSSRKEFKAQAISSEINVIGQTVDEACMLIDKYLDNCYLNGLNVTRIVHGKGTGALRNGIHKFLKTHPHVKSFRVGTFGEGEMGVTIVEIK